jgi:hypothetical protein
MNENCIFLSVPTLSISLRKIGGRNQSINLGEKKRIVVNGGSNTVVNLWVPQAGTA